MSDVAPDPVPAAPPRRPRRGYLLPGTIALVVCAVIATVIDVTGLQTRTPARLAAAQTETFLAQAIQAAQGLGSPPDVSCPASEPVRAGVRFICRVDLRGRSRVVAVTESGGGSLTWSLAPS